MESFRIDGHSGRAFQIVVEEVQQVTPELVQILIDIDLQTFAESTFSHYTAAAFLTNGRVYLMQADDVVIGTCVCMRSWERPNEATILSMGIRPGWRGRGLGQRFVSAVMNKLRSRGLRSVSLLVGKENRRAIKVYNDVGFEVASEAQVRAGMSGLVTLPDDALLLMRARLHDDDAPVIELSR
jgi:ribosomal protein S18 acetylase RimI-like enzyme